MKRKRTANKRKPQKKATVTNESNLNITNEDNNLNGLSNFHTNDDNNLNGLSNFVEQIANKFSGPDKYNADKLVASGAAAPLESTSESLSSSSGSDESFHVKGFGSYNDAAVDKPVQKLEVKRGRGRPRKEGTKKAMDLTNSLVGLNASIKEQTQSNMGLNPMGLNPMHGEQTQSVKGLNHMSMEQTQSNKLHQHPQHNKKELKASLEVIKKVMEMDEAVPFSAPMDPVSLGIPNYFDVIDTPMDFGTICSNLQNGVKYLNSGDVYKDVQYIWQNCLKVNKKGDYTVYLMKRVKKKFMKYWASAGLHAEITKKITEFVGLPNMVPSKDHYTRHDSCKETLIDNSISGSSDHMKRDNCSELQKDNHIQVQKNSYGISQPHPQVHQSSCSLPYQSFQPQPSVNPLAQFSQLVSSDSNFAGLSHLVAYIDHAIRHGRHEATLRENSVGNPSLMQKDKFGTSQLHSQVPPSSYSPPRQSQVAPSSYSPPRQSQVSPSIYSPTRQSHQPNPSTVQSPQFARLQDGTDSNNVGNLKLFPSKDSTMKRKKDAMKSEKSPLVIGVTRSKRQQPQHSSYFLRQSQPSTSQLKPPSLSTADIDNAAQAQPHVLPGKNGSLMHNEGVPRSSPDPMVVSPSQFEPHQPPLSHGQQNGSYQPQEGTAQPQPSCHLATVDILTAVHLHSPTENDRKPERRHAEQCSADISVGIPLLPGHSLPEQPSRTHHQLYQSQQLIKKKKGRGPTRCRNMWDMLDGNRIFVPINSWGQPVGPQASKLASFLGTIARDGKMVPLTFPDWHAMPDECKEEMWLFVQTKFDIDPMCKSWALKSIASKWRNWKARLKAEHYYPHKTDEERLKDCDRRVIPEQWPILISFWNNEELQLRCEKNKANRANQKVTHTSGSKSFARLREEERARRLDGSEPTRADLYIRTRTRKDGQPLNEKAAEIIAKLQEEATLKPQTSECSNEWEDAFCKVMGGERCGHVRMYGLGPTPSDLWGQKPGRIQLMRMASEAKRSANEEVCKMAAKMEAMEEKYASMEAQISRMTYSMQNFLDKMSVPSQPLGIKQVPGNLDAHEDSAQEEGHSSSSSRAVNEVN